MKSFTLVIYAAPSTQSARTALRVAREILRAGHSIYRLFFYQDGVFNASAGNVPAQDTEDLPAAWQSLVQAYNIDAVVCVASALQRGVVDQAEAERYDLLCSNLREGFVISGLGQLVDGALESDRLINFLP